MAGCWRRGRDSNPGYERTHITVFETAAFNRSATSPWRIVPERSGANRARRHAAPRQLQAVSGLIGDAFRMDHEPLIQLERAGNYVAGARDQGNDFVLLRSEDLLEGDGLSVVGLAADHPVVVAHTVVQTNGYLVASL